MATSPLRRLAAGLTLVSLLGAGVPARAGSAPATLTGTVFGSDLTTPVAKATVTVTDAKGHAHASEPTAADGAFALAGLPAGPARIALTTAGQTLTVATPVNLAPGQTHDVTVALKRGRADEEPDDEDRDEGAAVPSGDGRGLGWMIAVLVGFVVVGAEAINRSNDEPASPYQPYQPED